MRHYFTHPLNIAIETKDVEDLVSIDLRRLEAIHHKNWGVSMRTIFRRWWPVSSSIPLATPTTATHTGPHAMRWRGAIGVIVIAVISALRAS